jgi:hypothetical protein
LAPTFNLAKWKRRFSASWFKLLRDFDGVYTVKIKYCNLSCCNLFCCNLSYYNLSYYYYYYSSAGTWHGTRQLIYNTIWGSRGRANRQYARTCSVEIAIAIISNPRVQRQIVYSDRIRKMPGKSQILKEDHSQKKIPKRSQLLKEKNF